MTTHRAGHDAIDARFDHHPPRDAADARDHESARSLVKATAHALHDLLPECDEKRRAMDDLDDALMHANAALARARA